MPHGLTFTPSTSPYRAEGDKTFAFAAYNDTTGSLTIGMPVYVDVSDSAEFNVVYTTTSVAASATGFNNQTCGNVVLGTNANAGSNITCVGIYQPVNTSETPAKGAIIRVLVQGRGIVKLTTNNGATAVTVGAKIIASASFVNAVVGAAAVDKTIGTVTATAANDGTGMTIQSVPGAGSSTCIVNAFVKLA